MQIQINRNRRSVIDHKHRELGSIVKFIFITKNVGTPTPSPHTHMGHLLY